MPACHISASHLGQRLRDHRNLALHAGHRCRRQSCRRTRRPPPSSSDSGSGRDSRAARSASRRRSRRRRTSDPTRGRDGLPGRPAISADRSLRSDAYCSPSANRSRSSAAGFVATSAADGRRLRRRRRRRPAPGQTRATSPAIISPSRSAVRSTPSCQAARSYFSNVEPRRLQRERLLLLAPDARASTVRSSSSDGLGSPAGGATPASNRGAREQRREIVRAHTLEHGRALHEDARAPARPRSGWRADIPSTSARSSRPGPAPRRRRPPRVPARAPAGCAARRRPARRRWFRSTRSADRLRAGRDRCRLPARRGAREQHQRRFDQFGHSSPANPPAAGCASSAQNARAALGANGRVRPRLGASRRPLALHQLQHARDRRLRLRDRRARSHGCAPSPGSSAQPLRAAARRADPPPARAGRRPPRDRRCRARRARRRPHRRARPARASPRPADPAPRRAGTPPPRPARRAPDRAGSNRCAGAERRARRRVGQARLRRLQRLDGAAPLAQAQLQVRQPLQRLGIAGPAGRRPPQRLDRARPLLQRLVRRRQIQPRLGRARIVGAAARNCTSQ